MILLDGFARKITKLSEPGHLNIEQNAKVVYEAAD